MEQGDSGFVAIRKQVQFKWVKNVFYCAANRLFLLSRRLFEDSGSFSKTAWCIFPGKTDT